MLLTDECQNYLLETLSNGFKQKPAYHGNQNLFPVTKWIEQKKSSNHYGQHAEKKCKNCAWLTSLCKEQASSWAVEIKPGEADRKKEGFLNIWALLSQSKELTWREHGQEPHPDLSVNVTNNNNCRITNATTNCNYNAARINQNKTKQVIQNQKVTVAVLHTFLIQLISFFWRCSITHLPFINNL